jgi:hypothetical protein
MNVTINQIRQEMTTLVQAHDMVNSFFWGDFHRAYNEKEQFYPLVCSYLSDGAINTNLTQMQLVVIVCDKTFKGFENLNDTESDTVTVARHLFNVIKQSPRWNALLRVNSATLSKFIENTRDEVAGVILTMNVDVKQSRSLCDLPLDNYDFDGQFVGNQCEPVLIVNSNQTFTFSAASGTIVELPDTPVTVFDQDGNELGSSSVPSVTGGNVEVTITPTPCADASYRVEYENGTLIQEGTIASGGSVTVEVPNPIVCQDVVWTLFDTNGNVLHSGTEPAGGTLTITAPDGTVQINGEQVATVASGGMVNVAVENESGTPIGSFDDDTGVWVVPNCQDGTVTVNRDGVFFASQNVASGGTATVNVPSFKNTFTTKSGQTDTFTPFDDGALQVGREDTFFLLTNNNPFGHNRRFTGTNGGYHDGVNFRDKDGNITTKALAFPDNLMLDWAYYNGDNLNGQVMMWRAEMIPAGNLNWTQTLALQPTQVFGSFTGFLIPNELQAQTIKLKRVGFGHLEYEPWVGNISAANIWTNETSRLNTTLALTWNNSAVTNGLNAKSLITNSRVFYKIVNYSKDPVTGVVTIF